MTPMNWARCGARSARCSWGVLTVGGPEGRVLRPLHPRLRDERPKTQPPSRPPPNLR
jgi:hypothetical protein